MITAALKQAYTYWRTRPAPIAARMARKSAVDCLREARKDVAKGIARYPNMTGAGIGAASEDGLQWVERPEDIGLRFVGFTSELRNGRNSNYGFYCEDSQDETYRGAVYQLPARDGTPIYVAGYREGSTGRRIRTDWTDTSTGKLNDSNGPARLQLRALIYGDPADHDGSKRDAAIQADGIAERAAESAREYNEAWQAGIRFTELGAEIQTARREFLKLRSERKSMFGRLSASIIDCQEECGTLLTAIDEKAAALIESIREARADREKAKESVYSADMRAAFNEGAGESVFA